MVAPKKSSSVLPSLAHKKEEEKPSVRIFGTPKVEKKKIHGAGLLDAPQLKKLNSTPDHRNTKVKMLNQTYQESYNRCRNSLTLS